MAATAYAAPAQPGRPAAAAKGGYTPASRTLKMGMHGADIKRLQQRLASLGYYPGSEDGNFGIEHRGGGLGLPGSPGPARFR